MVNRVNYPLSAKRVLNYGTPMKKQLSLALFAGIAALGFGSDKPPAVAENNPVTVTYVKPEEFRDFRQDSFSRDSGQAELMTIFTDHLNSLARSQLAPGQRLEVKFLDIDLAGEFEPWRGPQFDNVRIMKDIYAPRFDLEFKLTGADGKILREGKRKLRDLFYLNRMVLDRSEPLCYEKDMLSDWIRDDIKFKARAAH